MDGLPSEGLAFRSQIRSPSLQLPFATPGRTSKFGTPLIGYFDDFGALVPANVERLALRTFEQFRNSLGATLKKTKTDRGKRIIFLWIQGDFPSPCNKMLLRIDLPADKATAWGNTIRIILSKGVISRDELESIIGGLSFAQTSVFGRIGRGVMAPLYAKLRSAPLPSHALGQGIYDPLLVDGGAT